MNNNKKYIIAIAEFILFPTKKNFLIDFFEMNFIILSKEIKS